MLPSLPLQDQGSRCALPCPAFYINAGDLNSGPRACMTGTLLSTLCPQTLSILSNESFLSRIKVVLSSAKIHRWF